MKPRGTAGFTLIELMIVMAIISGLATLAISNYFYAKRNAQNATAAAAMRSILPALDVASSRQPVTTVSGVAFGPDGGVLNPTLAAVLPEARNSDGVVGVITVQQNTYRIEAHHLNGTVCYTYDSANTPTYSAGPVANCTS